MDLQARCAFVHAQAICAMSEILAMQAQNQMRVAEGGEPVYGHDDFMAVQNNYMIGHNAVIEYLRD